MISDPLKYAEDFADAGADIITFHIECDSDIDKTIEKIRSRGVKPGLVNKTKTPASSVFPYLDELTFHFPLQPPISHRAFSRLRPVPPRKTACP